MIPGAVCVACAVVIALAPPLAAQSHPLVGSWDIQIQAGIHEADGKVNPVVSPGSVTFTMAGDSLVAVLRMTMAGPRPPARMASYLPGDTASFVKQVTALRTNDNRMTPGVATRRYRFFVQHDSLVGIMDTIDGDDANVAKLNNWPVTGVRSAPR